MEMPEKIGMNTNAGMPDTKVSDEYASQQRIDNTTYAQFMVCTHGWTDHSSDDGDVVVHSH